MASRLRIMLAMFMLALTACDEPTLYVGVHSDAPNGRDAATESDAVEPDAGHTASAPVGSVEPNIGDLFDAGISEEDALDTLDADVEMPHDDAGNGSPTTIRPPTVARPPTVSRGPLPGISGDRSPMLPSDRPTSGVGERGPGRLGGAEGGVDGMRPVFPPLGVICTSDDMCVAPRALCNRAQARCVQCITAYDCRSMRSYCQADGFCARL